MKQPITMPALSDTMSNGRLVKWVKKIGDPIKKGESVADVETDKAVMDVEAFHDGCLAGPLAAEGSEMPVGAIIGYIVDGAETTLAAAAETASPPRPTPLTPLTSPTLIETAPALRPAPARVRASPYARRLAQQRGLDVTQVASGDRPAEPPIHAVRASHVREALARNMTASVAIPTFRVTARLALAPLLAVSKDTGISLTLLLARACALTVKAHSLFNTVYTPEGFVLRERVDVAIAVDAPDGLVAPVIRDVARRALAELAVNWRAVRDKARSRRLSLQDYQGATFYLSNLGMFSVVNSFDAMLPVGATAILCVAAADGDRTAFTLGCDHRVLAGADAARFLQTFAEYLANPNRIAEGP